MIKTCSLTAFLLAFFLFSAQVYSRDIVFKQALSFSDIVELVDRLDWPEGTVVVMDDYETLMMPLCDLEKPLTRCQYVGGAAWTAWQKELLKNTPDSKFLIAKTEEELSDASSSVLSSSDVMYVENVIPNVLRTLTNDGVRLLLESGKGSNQIASTNKQLGTLNVPGKGGAKQSLASLIDEHALFTDKHDLAAFEKQCSPEGGTPVVFKKGVLYTSGQNKGKILKCMIDAYNFEADKNSDVTRIKNVLFLDDGYQNSIDVYYAYRGSKIHNVFAFNYIALQEHKDAFLSGEDSDEFKEKANKRWLEIKPAN